MTAPTNVITGETPNVGAREDLENTIYRVVREETPFTSNIGKVSVKAITHEWQTETLANADATNTQLEGDDVGTLDAPNLTTRVKNICQISWKTGGVSETQEAVDLAGRASEMARQKLLKGMELARDFEARFMGNYASVAESGATTRKSAGVQAFIETNTSRGATGSDGGYNTGTGIVDAAGNGTQRTWTEALLKAVQATAFSNGGKPTQIYMGPTHKQQFSAFTGIADIRSAVSGTQMATITGAADVYVGDFGALTAIPHGYALTRAAVLIDPKMCAVGTLRPMETKALAKTGSSEKFKIEAEKTLVVKNEKALAIVADLT